MERIPDTESTERCKRARDRDFAVSRWRWWRFERWSRVGAMVLGAIMAGSSGLAIMRGDDEMLTYFVCLFGIGFMITGLVEIYRHWGDGPWNVM